MHPPPLHRAAATALPVLLWVLAAGAGAGEPAARVIYPVDYNAHKVRVFEEVEWPLIAPPLPRRRWRGGEVRIVRLENGQQTTLRPPIFENNTCTAT